jgi:hypothetical protein
MPIATTRRIWKRRLAPRIRNSEAAVRYALCYPGLKGRLAKGRLDFLSLIKSSSDSDQQVDLHIHPHRWRCVA